MAALSNYAEKMLRMHLFRTGSFPKPTVLAVALCTVATTDADTGATLTEPPEADGYTRMQIDPDDANWSAPDDVNGVTKNQQPLVYGPASADWPTVTHFAIVDDVDVGQGNVLIHGSLGGPKTVENGETATIAVDGLSVTFA